MLWWCSEVEQGPRTQSEPAPGIFTKTNKQTKCKAVLQTFHHQLLSKGLTTRNPPVTFHIFLTFFIAVKQQLYFWSVQFICYFFIRGFYHTYRFPPAHPALCKIFTCLQMCRLLYALLSLCIYSNTGLILYPSVNGWTSHGPSVQSCTLLLFSVCVYSRLFLHSTCRPPGVEPVLPCSSLSHSHQLQWF